MSETIEQPNTTVSNIAIDKSYLLGALKSFDSNILEKKYSFKVDGDPVNGIKVPDTVAENNGTTFQYIGETNKDNNGLNYGYFYKIVYEEGAQLDKYIAIDSDDQEYDVYLNENHLWDENDDVLNEFFPINGAKFNLTDDKSKLTYKGLDYTKDGSVTGTLSGYLAISTQPDAAEPITYEIKPLDNEDDNLYIQYQLYKTELGVTTAVDDSVINIPKAKILNSTMLLTGVHEGDPTKVATEETGKYYATNYGGGVDPLPQFNNFDGDDTYIMLVFDTTSYGDDSELDEDKSYVYIPTTSLLDETDLGYGLEVVGGKFKVTTQVDELPFENDQAKLADYSNDPNKPNIVQLTDNGLFYELKSTTVEGVTTYEWKYIAPVIFNEQSIEFDVNDFQIGANEDSGTYDHPTTDAGAGEGGDIGDGPDLGE